MTATATRKSEKLPSEEETKQYFVYAYGTDGKVKDVLPTDDLAVATDMAIRASRHAALREVVIVLAGSTRREVFTSKSETSQVKYSKAAFDAHTAEQFLADKKTPSTRRSSAPRAKRERVQFDPTPLLAQLTEGIGDTVPASKTEYARITAHGKTLCYANFKAGWIQLDFAASDLEGADKKLLTDIKAAKGGKRSLLAAGDTAQARALLAHVASLRAAKAEAKKPAKS